MRQVWRREGGDGAYVVWGNWVEGRGRSVCTPPPPPPPHLGASDQERGLTPGEGVDAYAKEQAGDRKPETPEVEGAEGMIPGWEILKGLLLGNTDNGTTQVWPCYGLSATTGLGSRALPSTNIVITCNFSSTT